MASARPLEFFFHLCLPISSVLCASWTSRGVFLLVVLSSVCCSYARRLSVVTSAASDFLHLSTYSLCPFPGMRSPPSLLGGLRLPGQIWKRLVLRLLSNKNEACHLPRFASGNDRCMRLPTYIRVYSDNTRWTPLTRAASSPRRRLDSFFSQLPALCLFLLVTSRTASSLLSLFDS